MNISVFDLHNEEDLEKRDAINPKEDRIILTRPKKYGANSNSSGEGSKQTSTTRSLWNGCSQKETSSTVRISFPVLQMDIPQQNE
jgi:hypothetical protein